MIRNPHQAKIKYYKWEIQSATQLHYFEEGVRRGEFIYDACEACYIDTSFLTDEQRCRIDTNNFRYTSYRGNPNIKCPFCKEYGCRGVPLTTIKSEYTPADNFDDSLYRCEGEQRKAKENQRRIKEANEKEHKENLALIKKKIKKKEQDKSTLFWNLYAMTGKLPFIPSCRKK